MITVPVSTKLASKAPWPRSGVPEYVFAVRSHGGQSLGVGVEEYDWTLQVEARAALVSVQSFRSDGDVPGQPIGVFRLAVDDALLKEFYQAATAAKLGELHPAMTAHPGNTERLYTFEQPGQTTIRQVINNSDEASNATIAPLRQKINALLGKSFERAERAVQLDLKHSRTPEGLVFELHVTNIGVEPVCFDDPRALRSAGPLHRAVVLISEFPLAPPGSPPPFLRWQEIPLQPATPQPSTTPLISLPGGKTWTAATAPWPGKKGMRYLAYFTWANYGGEPMVQQVYRIRGKADSPRLVIDP